MAENLTISKMAQRCGLSPHTLRYYERIGLIESVARGSDGHRRYSTADIDWIAFVNRLRATGMSIRDMLKFAELRRLGDSSFALRRALLEAHTAKVGAALLELETSLAVLHDKIEYYRQGESAMTSLSTATKGSQHGKPKQSVRKRSAKTEGN
jgi:DNA-binding transcriptional MerR regulator